MGAIQGTFGPDPLYIAYTMVSCTLHRPWIVYGLSRLTGLVAEVHRTRLGDRPPGRVTEGGYASPATCTDLLG